MLPVVLIQGARFTQSPVDGVSASSSPGHHVLSRLTEIPTKEGWILCVCFFLATDSPGIMRAIVPLVPETMHFSRSPLSANQGHVSDLFRHPSKDHRNAVSDGILFSRSTRTTLQSNTRTNYKSLTQLLQNTRLTIHYIRYAATTTSATLTAPPHDGYV